MSIPFAGTEITKRGWQCPGCGRVYAPWVTMCASCPGTTGGIVTNVFVQTPWERIEEDGHGA